MPEYQLVRSPLHPALPEELVVLAACFAAGSQAYSWLTALYHVLSYVDEKYQAAEKEAERVKLLFQEAARAAEAPAANPHRQVQRQRRHLRQRHRRMK